MSLDRPGIAADPSARGQRLVELRCGHGRVHDRHDDSVWRELSAGDLREHVERRLRGRVSTGAREHHARCHGADVHDDATALPAHRRDHRLHCEERCVDVELRDRPQVVEPDLLERHVEALTGVVDEDVHAPEAIQGRSYQRDDLRRVPQIHRHRERTWQLVRQLLEAVHAARGQHHPCPACSH